MSKGKQRNVKILPSSGWKSRWVHGCALEGPNPCSIWESKAGKALQDPQNHLGAVVPQGNYNKILLCLDCSGFAQKNEKIGKNFLLFPFNQDPPFTTRAGCEFPALQGDPKNPLRIISSQFLS